MPRFDRASADIQLRDRVVGCLLGGAVGDALGAPVEFLSLKEIIDRFGAVSFEKLQVEGRWRFKGKLYRDRSSRLIADIPDTLKTANG